MRRRLLALGVLVVAVAVPVGAQPAQDWDSLRAVYDYDASAPLDATAEEALESGQYTVQALSFAGFAGERVPALLMRPVAAERPPCVLFLHGLGGDKSNAKLAAGLLAPHGIAVLAIDAALHGARAPAGVELTPELLLDGRPMVRTVIDNRRAIDYIATRSDLDAQRVVLVGVSMGAILGSIVAAVDERVDAAALLVGGGGWERLLASSEHPLVQRLREAGGGSGAAMAHLDPVHFVGHISPRPLLMINGTQDAIIPRACADALHEAAGEAGQVIWYEGGHVGMPVDVLASLVAWIVAQTGVAALPG
ncbi:MAG: alpha/beta hydrolase family protein [Armatimonadota bacterium]